MPIILCGCDCGPPTIDNGPDVLSVCGYNLPERMRLQFSGFPDPLPTAEGQAFKNTQYVMKYAGTGAWRPEDNGNGPPGSYALCIGDFLTSQCLYTGDDVFAGQPAWCFVEIRVAVTGSVFPQPDTTCPPDDICACNAQLVFVAWHVSKDSGLILNPFPSVPYGGIYAPIFYFDKRWTYDQVTDSASVQPVASPTGDQSDNLTWQPKLYDVDLSRTFIWQGDGGEKVVFKP